jgi:circadian clock protein KaiB
MNRSPLFRFRLYVAGDTQNSAQAVANLVALCQAHLPDRHEIEVVDVFREPKRALADGIFMTPTLVKLGPHTHFDGARVARFGTGTLCCMNPRQLPSERDATATASASAVAEASLKTRRRLVWLSAHTGTVNKRILERRQPVRNSYTWPATATALRFSECVLSELLARRPCL